MTYQTQIKSPQWQKKRLEILNLRGFKCENCSCETEQLHVHHRFYIKGRKIYEYDNDVFQVLCEKCHTEIHKKLLTNKIEKIVEVIPEKYKEIIKVLDGYNEQTFDYFKNFIENSKHLDNKDIWYLLDYSLYLNCFDIAFDRIRDKIELDDLSIKVSILENKKSKKNYKPFKPTF